MTIGYIMDGHDNGTYMLPADANGWVCPKCDTVLDRKRFNPEYIVKRTNMDVSVTYDGFDIVSDRFKQFCEDNHYRNIRFVRVAKSPGFYWFIAKKTVAFDSEKRQTEFEDKCSLCGAFASIIGRDPAFLKDHRTRLPDAFFQTDLCFGWGRLKAPAIIVGCETKAKLAVCKFKGIAFSPVKA